MTTIEGLTAPPKRRKWYSYSFVMTTTEGWNHPSSHQFVPPINKNVYKLFAHSDSHLYDNFLLLQN